MPTSHVGPVTLEVSDPDAGNLPPAVGAEVLLSDTLTIVPINPPSSNSAPMPPALGFPLFLSSLQVSRPLPFITYVDKQILLLTFELAKCPQLCICSVEILWRSYPRSSFVFNAVESSPALEADR
jgi:hypothetical protein